MVIDERDWVPLTKLRQKVGGGVARENKVRQSAAGFSIR
jgi:hypothetical protein